MIGIDLVDIERMRGLIARRPNALDRLFTSSERSYSDSKADPVRHLAARFAAKEAVFKAMGTGLRGMRWHEVRIVNDELGRPVIDLSGRAKSFAEAKQITNFEVSLSHDRDHAIAVALALTAHKCNCNP